LIEEPNAASVALFSRGRVLLIQRARPPYQGLWTLPGGRMEPGETAEAAAAREIREELGLDVFRLRPVTRLALAADAGEGNRSDDPARGFFLQVFATDTFAGDIATSEEVAGYRWIECGRIDSLRLTPHLQEVMAAALAVFHGH
jgi:8-oxo-dGTP pyrophosphatase MutT (NUDIX family)